MAKFSSTKTVITYNYLRMAARQSLEEAEKSTEGSLYNSMMSLIGTPFFLEAYLNHLGERVLSYWSDLERISQKKS